MDGGDTGGPDQRRTPGVVLDRLGLRIASGACDGEKWKLEQIAHDHHITRAMAREVCMSLAARGLVVMRQRSGVLVQPQDRWHLLDPRVIAWRLEVDFWPQVKSLTDLRLAVEPHCASLAAVRATSPQRGMLRGYADQLEQIGRRALQGQHFDDGEYLKVDKGFHRTLLAASGNEVFASLGSAIDLVLEARQSNSFSPVEGTGSRRREAHAPQPVALLLHVAVAEAIFQSHSDGAALYMTAILDEVRGRIDARLAARVTSALGIIGLDTPENLEILDAASSGPVGGSDPAADGRMAGKLPAFQE